MLRNDNDKNLSILGWSLHAAGLLGLFVGAVVVHLATSSMIGQKQQQNAQEVTRLNELLATAKVVRQVHQELKTSLSELEQHAETVRQRIPDQPRESEFLRQVTQAADDEGLKIRDYQRGTVTDLPTHSQFEVRLRGEGSYESICRFLDRMSRMSRAATVQWMELLTNEGTDIYPLDLTLVLYFNASDPGGES